MTINYIPNDPNSRDAMPMRRQPAQPDRPPGRAGFTFALHAPEALYDYGTLDFLFWQSREAALAAVGTWETFAGELTAWADRSDDRSQIGLSPVFDDGQTFGSQRLNAYYDGTGVRLFDFDNGVETIYSGNSADTVSHEVGHALLDSVRPDLWQSMMPEVNAFHEAFGDCMAVLTALADQPTRIELLRRSPRLDTENFVEATSEYLAAAVLTQFGTVAPSQPRHLLNNFRWQLPSTLPAGTFEDPPERLSREPHSFSRVVSGCFYDVLRGLFAAGPAKDQNALAEAATTAGRLLVAAARACPETARYFQAIGRAMVRADQQLNDGRNRQSIGAAFAGHGIMLGSAAMIAPSAALAGPAPSVTGTTATLAGETLEDLRRRIGAGSGAAFAVRAVPMMGADIAEALHRREVALDHIDPRLRGVITYAAEPVLVGASGGRAAVLGALPEPTRTFDEVSAYVETLISHHRIRFGDDVRHATAPPSPEPPFTHVIHRVAQQRVLTRVRYLCRSSHCAER